MSETYVQRNVNLKKDIADLVQNEQNRRRNGPKGFSLTLNQIVLEWLDGHNAGVLPIDTRAQQDVPAVKRVIRE
jgi:hypothetical protein